MSDASILDFRAQAEQMMQFIEENLQSQNRAMVREMMMLKLKSMYQHGVAAGRLYENEGVYPYMDAESKAVEETIS